MTWFGSLLLDVTYVGVLLLVSILTYFYYSFLYWQRKHVPYIPATFPFGNAKSIALSKESFSCNWFNIYRQFRDRGCKYGGFYIFSRPLLMIIDPELIKSILTKDFSHFHDRNVFVNEKVDPLSFHLFSAKGNRWRKLRRKVSPVFTSGKMKMMFGLLLKVTEELTSILEKFSETAEPVAIKSLLSKFTLDVIGTCVFGIECNSLKNEDTEFARHGNAFVSGALANNFFLMVGMVYTKLMELLRVKSTSPEISDFYINVLKETIETREKHNIHRNDFIELFIKLKNNENITDENGEKSEEEISSEVITFNELAAQAFSFFIAGFDSTATTLSFCLYELALHPDIQEKLREEILEVLKKYDGKITYEAVAEMKYMDQVIQETLRKYPTSASLLRECTEDYKIPNSDVTIDKGTLIIISNFGLHRDPEYYPNPEKFDPERFNPEEKEMRHPFTYLPFGEGPRICIGMRFALLEIKTALTTALKNYKFSVDPKTFTHLEFASTGVLLDTKSKIFLQVNKVCD